MRPSSSFHNHSRLPLSALMMAAGVLFLRSFPITRERHAEVRDALDARFSETAEDQRAP